MQRGGKEGGRGVVAEEGSGLVGLADRPPEGAAWAARVARASRHDRLGSGTAGARQLNGKGPLRSAIG